MTEEETLLTEYNDYMTRIQTWKKEPRHILQRYTKIRRFGGKNHGQKGRCAY